MGKKAKADKQGKEIPGSPTGNGPRIGVYVCHCGRNIDGSLDCEDVAKFASSLDDVVLAKDSMYTCSDSGQALERPLVVFAEE